MTPGDGMSSSPGVLAILRVKGAALVRVPSVTLTALESVRDSSGSGTRQRKPPGQCQSKPQSHELPDPLPRFKDELRSGFTGDRTLAHPLRGCRGASYS